MLPKSMTRLMPDFIVDKIIRRRAALHKTPVDHYRVRIARTVKEYEDAFSLLHVAYVYQGYETFRGDTMRITPQHVLPESTVFTAYDAQGIVGTMTVTLDSPAGLPLEYDYPDQVFRLRQQGASVVEYGSLAVVQRCVNTGVTTLLSAASHWWSMNVLEATHCIIGVNPKAVPFYRALFAFELMGGQRQHAELTAPVQGMLHNLNHAQEHFERCFTQPMSNGLSFGKSFINLDFPCMDIPRDMPREELIRWKLPRNVFQELFIRKSDRLDSLDPRTNRHLRRMRTDCTLELSLPDVSINDSEMLSNL